MKYISTRGESEPCSFDDTLLLSIASDEGLFYPESIPKVDEKTLEEWSSLDYEDLCAEILHLFIGSECISKGDLNQVIRRSLKDFDVQERIPINKFHDDYIAELYHGPSLSENDFAMQFLGNYLEYYVNKHLKQKNDQPKIITVIIGSQSTSGPACLQALQSKSELISCFALYSSYDVRRVAEKEMSKVMGTSVHCIHVINSCTCEILSEIVEMIKNKRFQNYQYLVSANALNWFRILLEIPFYFYTSLHLYKQGIRDIALSTNSANMTSMMAGILARDMGCPMSHLLISCDRKDPIQSLFQTGRFDFLEYKTSPNTNHGVIKGNCQFNFERLIYYLYDDPYKVREVMSMKDQEEKDYYQVDAQLLKEKLSFVYLHGITEDLCNELCTRLIKEQCYYCPYTLCSLFNTELYKKEHPSSTVVTFSVSHPGKYPYYLASQLHSTPGNLIPEYMIALNSNSTRKSSIDIHQLKLEVFIFSQAWDSMKQYLH